MAKIKIPKYSLAEELINSISHGIGAIFAIIALVMCLIKASTVSAVISCIIYCLLMLILYVISCIYHALSPNVKGKKVLRVIDHCNVMLMVAGTYMPICLSLFDGFTCWITFSIVWVITIIGVVFNAINVDKYAIVSVICNLLLGWGAVVLVKPMLELISLKAINLLILGGILYTIGSILYGLGSKIPYMHSIFHFFVLAGSVCHFIFIYLYCI